MPAESKPALLRQLGVSSAAALVISNMIGTGIFTSTGFQAGDVGDPIIILWLWVAGAVCALAGAFCYSELGINFPSSGGEYVYLTRAFGPIWGFMTGWISFVAGFAAAIVTCALACAAYLSFFFPSLNPDKAMFTIGSGNLALSIGGAQFLTMGLVVAFSALNIFGIKWSGKVQTWLTGSKLVIIVSFILLGLLVGKGDWGNFAVTTERWKPETPMAAQFAVSMFWVYVSYSGWNAATYVAEELERPARTLPLALALGTGIVAVLFLLLNVVFIYASPVGVLKGQMAVGTLTAKRLFGDGAAGIFSVLMGLSLLGSMNAMVTIGPRVYYAMARNGAFFARAAKVHPVYHTPAFAIIAQGVMTMILAMASFRSLMTYIGILLNFFAMASVASLFFLRKRPGWQKLKVVSFAYPLIPAVFCVVGVWMTYQGFTQQPKITFTALGTVLVGALIYKVRFQGRGIEDGR